MIEENATIVGQELKNVELPTDTLITAVIRGNRVITPRGDTFIEAGDVLYVLVPKTNRSAIKKLFRQSENEQ